MNKDFTTRPLNKEQQSCEEAALKLESFKILAYAGTGKTKTLEAISFALGSRNKKGLYLAFNRAVADEAKKRFDKSVTCKTFHSLAHSHVPEQLSKKVFNPKNFPKDLAVMYHLKDSDCRYSDSYLEELKHRSYKKFMEVSNRGGSRRFTPYQKMQYVNDAVKNFCKSSDTCLLEKHFEPLDWLKPNENKAAIKELLPIAMRRWNDLIAMDNNLNISHDVYVKYWSLTNPKITGFDYLLLDEWQDSDELMNFIVSNQSIPCYYVGDKYQQIYEWRGATNSLEKIDLPTYRLTHTFRFGENLANHANLILSCLGETVPLIGNPEVHTSVIYDHDLAVTTDAILCRTNKGAFSELVYQLQNFPERKFALLADVNEIKKWLEAAEQLIKGTKTYHPDLNTFDKWEDVIEYTELNKSDNDFSSMVRLINQFSSSFSTLYSILNRVENNANNADCVITTVHKAKGLEWDSVLISSDFDLCLMPNKFSGVEQRFKKNITDELYLENWELIPFPNTLKLIPNKDNFIEGLLPSLDTATLDHRMYDQVYRVTDMPVEELRLLYVAITRAKKTLYAANLAEFFILLEKLRKNLD
ncbi:UvrD-helicase domain-containing protein [Acinetobacter baumannii]